MIYQRSRIICHLIVSIPKRVSEALKPPFSYLAKGSFLFQSLKGFQRLWSALAAWAANSKSLFQSLKGFQRLWSNALLENARIVQLVSIPKRVSEALKNSKDICWEQGCSVSIPKRVSEALKHHRRATGLLPLLFQSLKGFQRLWSGGFFYLIITLRNFVSIPKRVSEALKPNAAKPDSGWEK